MANIVITGGTGFIGSHLSTYHINLGDTVTSIDNLSTSTRDHPRPDKFVPFDLSIDQDLYVIEDILDRADVVYHMASSVGVKHVDNNPKKTLRNSTNINNIMFPLFEKYNNRVIFASSSEVYGNTDEAKETDTLQIGSPDTLRWGYACGKLMSEFLLKTYDFPSTIVRFFNVTGSGQLHNYGMVLPTFIHNIKNDKNITVYGDGLQYRTFCDVRDAVRMLHILSGSTLSVNEIYNIGNPENTITIGQLAKKVLAISGSTKTIIYKPYEEEFSKDHGEIYRRKPNTDKIDQLYKAKYSIEDIIASML